MKDEAGQKIGRDDAEVHAELGRSYGERLAIALRPSPKNATVTSGSAFRRIPASSANLPPPGRLNSSVKLL